MRNTLIAALLIGMFPFQYCHALDLVQAYKEALVNDPEYESARYALTAGQEQLTQGRAGLLPTVIARGSYSDVKRDAENPAGETLSSDYRLNTYTVSLIQPLFRWQNWKAYEQGKLSVAASEVQFSLEQQNLIIRVSQAYFDVLTAQDALSSIQAQRRAISEQLESAKQMFEKGAATITDSQEAQARYDLTLAQEAAAINDLDVSRTALEQIIGKPAENLAGLRPDVRLASPQPAEIDKWVDRARSQNFGVIAQELNREIAKLEISRARAGHMPTLDFVASRSHTNQKLDSLTALTDNNNVGDTTTVGVQWTIPLFSGFSVTSQVREALALSERARADLESARRSAIQSARQSFLSLNSGLAQVKALEAAEVSSRLALESNIFGYQYGARIGIDILNAQQQLYATLRDLARARYDTLVNGLRLKAAAGILAEEDLVEVNRLLTNVTSHSMLGRLNTTNADFKSNTERISRQKK